nr:hypothetical protein [Tanacetum cinerariifolium]
GSESIPEADIPLRKRARFTTPTGGYEVGESPVAAAARQIRPALTIADRRRAGDRLIGRMRRERRYFRTLSTTYAQEVAHSRYYCTQIMDNCQSREVHTSTLVTQIEALQRDVSTWQRQHIDDEDRLTRHIQHEHAQRDVAPEDGDTTTTTVTEAQLQALIDQGVAAAMAEAEASRVRNGYGGNGSRPRLAQAIRECTYPDCYFGSCSWKTLKKMMTDKYCPRDEIKKRETEMWELKTKGTNVIGYSRHFQELALMCDRTFPEESDRVEKYIGGVPDIIHDSVKATKPKTMQEAIEFATELMDKMIRDAVENKQKFEGISGNNQNKPHQNKRQNTSQVYAAGNSDRNIYTWTSMFQV